VKKLFVILTALSLLFVFFYYIYKNKKANNLPVKPDLIKTAEISGYSLNAYESKLISSLDSPEPKDRWNAAANLGILHSQDAVPHLINTCKDQNPQVRMLSIWALGKIKNSASIKTMKEMLTDSDIDVRPFAIWALGQTGDKKAAFILENSYIDFTEYGNQQLIINSLGKIGNKSSLPFLLKKINDENQLIGLTAIEALGNYKEKTSEEALLKILKSGKREYLIQALRSLKKAGSENSLPAVAVYLKDPDQIIRFEAERTSKVISEGREKKDSYDDQDPLEKRELLMEKNAHPTLDVPELKRMNPEDISNFGLLPIKASQKFDYDLAVKDLQSGERSLIYDAVWRMGNSADLRVVPLLISVLKQEGDRGLRWNAAKALGKLRDKRAVPHLIDLLDEPNPDVREDVVEALGRIRDKQALKPLMDMLQKEKEDYIVAEIIIATGLIGVTNSELYSLTTLLKRDNPVIRANVLLVLGKHGNKDHLSTVAKYVNDSSTQVTQAAKRAIEALEGKREIDLEDHYHEL